MKKQGLVLLSLFLLPVLSTSVSAGPLKLKGIKKIKFINGTNKSVSVEIGYKTLIRGIKTETAKVNANGKASFDSKRIKKLKSFSWKGVNSNKVEFYDDYLKIHVK